MGKYCPNWPQIVNAIKASTNLPFPKIVLIRFVPVGCWTSQVVSSGGLEGILATPDTRTNTTEIGNDCVQANMSCECLAVGSSYESVHQIVWRVSLRNKMVD